MLAGQPAFLFLTIKEVDGVAVIAFLETVSMFEGDKVESLAKELFGVIEAKKCKKILLNLYNAGYVSSTMLAQLVNCTARCRMSKGRSGSAACVHRSWTRSKSVSSIGCSRSSPTSRQP